MSQTHNIVLMWLALAEGMYLTWADFCGYYAPQFYWSGLLDGARVVEVTYRPRLRLVKA